MIEFLIVFIVVLVANMLPVFGPPTWMILSILALMYNLPILEIIVVGAIASSIGRFVLATYVGPLADKYLPKKKQRGIKYLHNFIKYENGLVPFGFSFLYSLSPLPSNALFIVAGAAHLRLIEIMSGFFVGRLISYGVIVGVAKAIVTPDNLFSPTYLLLDAVGIALAIGILFADWQKVINHMIEREKRRREESAVREIYK